MRCTVSLCQSGNTRQIERHLTLYYDTDSAIVHAYIDDIWLCNTCGNPFKPAVARATKWELPFGKRYKHIPKSLIIKELFK